MKIRNILFGSYFFTLLMMVIITSAISSEQKRKGKLFCKSWSFNLGDVLNGQEPNLDDSQWRLLDLPHDWSIEGKFGKDHPATTGGGALPGGIGWYRKNFCMPDSDNGKSTFIEFDGVYRNSEVWINGRFLGKRPNGYISFRYELTPFLKYGEGKNVLAVRVDNSQQPNSRWYSGSGIYRNVRLVTTEKIHVAQWGTFIMTSEVSEHSAKVSVRTEVRNVSQQNQPITIKTVVLDKGGRKVVDQKTETMVPKDSTREIYQELTIQNPVLWSLEDPHLYRAVTTIECTSKVCDDYETAFGIRAFDFDSEKGFVLNGKHIKIKGVCNHHDLGCLGAAINIRALERQLEILKNMGVNGIRTSHNPPAPELLDLCDRMGFIVMDEAFDMWTKKKTDYDYALNWDDWHRQDLKDMILRDRNHPSVFIWSIGNEVVEQWDKNDSSGTIIARELAAIVKSLDPTRPITAACNDLSPLNPVIKSDVLDLIGYNYHQGEFSDFPKIYPGKRFIATETTSALATRGHYDMPSDSIRRWPPRWDLPLLNGNPDNTCSSYDNCSAPWGSTHEETWKIVKKYDFISGMYIWTGFDYLGEPTPYSWPSRSSYFGIVDLAGFPKDVYYMYQSEWTDKEVLHVFPHWNWNEGDTVDVWAYTSCDEVELLLNDRSLGSRKKAKDNFHTSWRVPFASGILKAIGRTDGKEILSREIKTAAAPAKIALEADRHMIAADGRDLSFVTVRILDENSTLVPNADNLVHFTVTGKGSIVGVDNGLQTSDESFKTNSRRAFNGMCLVVIQSTEEAGRIKLTAASNGLKESTIAIDTN